MMISPWFEEDGKYNLKCSGCGKVYDYTVTIETMEDIEMEAIMDKWEFSDRHGVLCPECVKELADEALQ